MHLNIQYNDFVPAIIPRNMNGKLSYKIRVKSDYIREDGTSAIYLAIYYDGKTKKVPLNINVPVKDFDSRKQRVKNSYKFSKDFNLLIEKLLGDLNRIEINYRLNDEEVTIDKVLEDLYNPSLRICYHSFASKMLEYEYSKGVIKVTTYNQQKGALAKIKRYRTNLLFSDINEELLIDFRFYLKNKLKNKATTIEGTVKNFKKFLHMANDKGIKTQLKYNEVKVKSIKGDFTFLDPSELKKVYEYYNSELINNSWKDILQRYLFSCFTGLRLGEIKSLKEDNFINDFVVFPSPKTGKLSKIKLNKTAFNLINFPNIFNGKYSDAYLNRELKQIAKALGIKKNLYYHSSRHTFATNYLISGGQIQNLQKLLNHSKIETTMIYVHLVDKIINKEVDQMDDIIL